MGETPVERGTELQVFRLTVQQNYKKRATELQAFQPWIIDPAEYLKAA
jgi:hypothetical protein